MAALLHAVVLESAASGRAGLDCQRVISLLIHAPTET